MTYRPARTPEVEKIRRVSLANEPVAPLSWPVEACFIAADTASRAHTTRYQGRRLAARGIPPLEHDPLVGDVAVVGEVDPAGATVSEKPDDVVPPRDELSSLKHTQRVAQWPTSARLKSGGLIDTQKAPRGSPDAELHIGTCAPRRA
jgi:hypothetical protein